MIIGMDFGTTNSGMAVYDGNRLRLIPLDPMSANPQVARSALYITTNRAVHIGRDAIDTYYRQNLNRPSRFERVRVGEIELYFAEVGAFIRDVYVEKDVLSPGRLFVSFKTGLSSSTYLGTIIGTDYYFLEDIIAVYLYVARKRAEAYLQTELDTILLGRPVRFSDDPVHNDLARERLLQAAFRAGYKTVYLQYEPIAAAHYYETSIEREQNALIFDFGGGTLDISIVRLGNPKTRRVLATGGIPIAGDVFDRKIVRAKLPVHFGEGGAYRDGDKEFPVPNSYYEAFSDWQELLLLQRQESLEGLRRIERRARQPLKIRALYNLITSHHGLKMFDMAEAAKRDLSSAAQTLLRFDGPGFAVRDVLARAEFESIIRADIQAISARLDAVLAEAGMRPDQIDAVIRTGGSSQIPVFIDLLAQRYGADKVRDIDTFSSVTSGLGIIARQIERGEVDLPAHTRETQRGGEYLNTRRQGGIPVVDLGMMRRMIDIKEAGSGSENQTPVLVAGTPDDGLAAVELPHPPTLSLSPIVPAPSQWGGAKGRGDFEIPLKQIGLPASLGAPIAAFPPDEGVLMMTSEYRVMVRAARELADLFASGLDFMKVHDLHSDAFGAERVCALAAWSSLENAAAAVLLNTRGYARLLVGEGCMSPFNQPAPYQMERGRGYPAALVRVAPDGDLLVISHAGRAVYMPVRELSPGEQRLIQLPGDAAIIGAFYLDTPREIVVATASGYGLRMLSAAIPHTALNTSGEKVITRAQPVVARLYEPDKPLWAVTNKRVVSVDQAAIPLVDPGDNTAHPLLKLKKGERLLSVVYGACG